MKKQYLYQPLPDEFDKSVLRIKDPERGKEKIEVDYLKKKAFRNFCNSENEKEHQVKVIGYTKFKHLKDNDEESANKALFLHGHKYLINEKKHLFNRVKGYIRVKDITEETKRASSDTTYFVAVTRFTFIPLLPLLFLLLLMILLLSHCPKQESTPIYTSNPTVETTAEATTSKQFPNMPIDTGATDWDGEMPTNPSSTPLQEEIEFVGYEKITVSEDNPIVELINPYGNTVFFKYSVYAENTLICTTDLIPQGKSIKWNAFQALKQAGYSSADGEIEITFYISTYDINTQQPCNPAQVKTTITIT